MKIEANHNETWTDETIEPPEKSGSSSTSIFGAINQSIVSSVSFDGGIEQQ